MKYFVTIEDENGKKIEVEVTAEVFEVFEDDRKLRAELANLLEQNKMFAPKDAEQLAEWNPYDQNAVSPFFTDTEILSRSISLSLVSEISLSALYLDPFCMSQSSFHSLRLSTVKEI